MAYDPGGGTMNPETFSVGISISTLYWWLTGLSAGGIVTPFYFYMFINNPLRILYTLGSGLITYLLVLLMNRFLILYGKKRLAVNILTGILVKLLIDYITIRNLPVDYISTTIGTIIPGLIANDFYRQGVLKTIFSVGIVTAIIYFFIVFLKVVLSF
jgi:poly-gamma-glutamate biosynthesis protein PgsC/CapC